MADQLIDQLFQIMGAYNRFRIVEMLEKRPLSMKEIAEEINISIPAVLKHLNFLEKVGIVESKSVRKEVEGRPQKIYFLTQRIIPKIILNDEIQAIELYKITPRTDVVFEYDLEDIRLKRVMLKVKLKRLEKKRLKILKEIEKLDRIERESRLSL
ncbi:MAG: ArsR family transcriptional regulator [Nitrososphaeria archaeon]